MHVILLMLGGQACVIPPDLQVQQFNSPPKIALDFSSPAPLTEVHSFDRSPPDADPSEYQLNEFNIRFRDPDGDPVTVRAFLDRDYSNFFDERRVPAGAGASDRDVRFPYRSFCNNPRLGNVDGFHQYELYITDTDFVPAAASEPDLRDTTTVEGRKGGRDNVLWEIECKGVPSGDL